MIEKKIQITAAAAAAASTTAIMKPKSWKTNIHIFLHTIINLFAAATINMANKLQNKQTHKIRIFFFLRFVYNIFYFCFVFYRVYIHFKYERVSECLCVLILMLFIEHYSGVLTVSHHTPHFTSWTQWIGRIHFVRYKIVTTKSANRMIK